jgi:hypothetical protein
VHKHIHSANFAAINFASSAIDPEKQARNRSEQHDRVEAYPRPRSLYATRWFSEEFRPSATRIPQLTYEPLSNGEPGVREGYVQAVEGVQTFGTLERLEPLEPIITPKRVD